MTKSNLHSAYAARGRFYEYNDQPSKTKQSFREESNINLIMAKYTKTGLIDHVNKHGGQYKDMPTETDFHASMSVVAEANSMFEELPAAIRAEFENDTGKFLDFVTDPENSDALVEMGLANAPQEPRTEDPTPEVEPTPEQEPTPALQPPPAA